ncbi:hypothetical protein AKJ41_05480 [candidate division MSBL1 archaeon SCGC-AAA259O05]|uniref:Uncharacterized protein n=1 Tax=candidate division MSBL1 archaeon SCGC-AAA259O05 TaxID=1698271 RepID=A0A133UZ07_9EURY|nr:hypothetical protein AKJ41_05480 [candidate division MSBL1 archaeon SCGC-AAA259O05]
MKLYDIEKQEWRGEFEERGESWRSELVYRCEICHTKTNKWHIGGWPGKGPRLLCPGDEYEEHDELESILERYDELEALFDLYNSIDRETAQEMDELRLQIDLLGEKVEELRKKFSEGVDDVEGVGPDAQVKSFYPSTRYAGEKRSLGR